MPKTFEGRVVKSPTASHKLNSPRTPKFIFMHHPNTWDLVETENSWEILPLLTKFQLIAGLNGVKLRPGGGVDSTAARAAFMDQGWTFIPVEKIKDGYLREFDGTRGPIYVDKWTLPRKIGSSVNAKVVWDTDQEGYNSFRRSLLEDGTIDKPDPSTLEWKIELLKKRIGRKIKSSHIPQVQKEIDEATEKKVALKEMKTGKKPSTRKKRVSKKSTPAISDE